jgi:hypothetical protein
MFTLKKSAINLAQVFKMSQGQNQVFRATQLSLLAAEPTIPKFCEVPMPFE